MFTSKPLSSLVIALITATTLVGCNKTPDSAPKDSPASIATPAPSASSATATTTTNNPNLPSYNVLIDATYPPFESKNADGTVGGMEVELFNAIAKDQGFNVTYIPHEWDGIFDSLKKNKGSIVVSAVGITDEAKANADLSDVYYVTPYRITTMSADKLASWEKLPKIGISESEDAATDLPERYGVKPEQLVSYKTVFLAMTALLRGDVDAVVADSTVSQYYLGSDAFKADKDKFVAKNTEIRDSSKLVFAVQKGNPDLLAKINKGLANIKASGEYEKIMTKYHQQPLSASESTTTTATASQVASPAK